MLSMYGCWEIEYYTTPLSEEEIKNSSTGAKRVCYADEVPPQLLNRIRAVRNQELARLRKGIAQISSAETYEHTLIRRHRPKNYTGPDLRFKAFMDVEYTDDWEKYPPVPYEDVGLPVDEDLWFKAIPGGIKFVCYPNETPEEYLSVIRKFSNVEFRKR